MDRVDNDEGAGVGGTKMPRDRYTRGRCPYVTDLRFGLSYRGVEELLTERGITVDHVTIYRWCSASPRC